MGGPLNSCHVFLLTESVNRKIGLLYRTRSFLKGDTLNTIYQSNVLPSLEYCDVVWGNAAKKYLKLTKLQNRAGKTILNVDRLFPTKSMLDCLGWKTLDSRREAHLNIMVYKCVTAKAPLYLCNNFHKIVSDNTSYQTRGSTQGNLIPPTFKNGSGKRTFRYRGAVSWNKLPATCNHVNHVYCSLALNVQYAILPCLINMLLFVFHLYFLGKKKYLFLMFSFFTFLFFLIVWVKVAHVP